MLSLQIRKVGAGPPVHRMIDVHAKHVCSPSRYADLEHIGIQIVRSPSSTPADRSNQSNLAMSKDQSVRQPLVNQLIR